MTTHFIYRGNSESCNRSRTTMSIGRYGETHGGRHERMAVDFTTTCAISAYDH